MKCWVLLSSFSDFYLFNLQFLHTDIFEPPDLLKRCSNGMKPSLWNCELWAAFPVIQEKSIHHQRMITSQGWSHTYSGVGVSSRFSWGRADVKQCSSSDSSSWQRPLNAVICGAWVGGRWRRLGRAVGGCRCRLSPSTETSQCDIRHLPLSLPACQNVLVTAAQTQHASVFFCKNGSVTVLKMLQPRQI